MKIVKTACMAAMAAVSAIAPANAVTRMESPHSKSVNNCYYQYSYISPDGDFYDIYYCYSNGDGSY